MVRRGSVGYSFFTRGAQSEPEAANEAENVEDVQPGCTSGTKLVRQRLEHLAASFNL